MAQQRCFILAALALISVQEAAMGDNGSVDWVCVAEDVAWAPRDSCGEVVFDGRMWLLGGWLNSESIGPRDVWSSSDGVHWSEATHEAGWRHGDLPTAVVFGGRMWFMGGWYAGRLPEGCAGSEVWSSQDGVEWDCATEQAGWSPRIGAAGVVFKDKMWILGGLEQYFFGDESHLRNDVWCTEDGATWRQVTDRAPWSPRAFHGALVFDGKIWVFGGGNYLPTYRGYNDVWCSEDGLHWTQVTEHAGWAPRIWFSAVVYRGCMWVLGGWANDPSRNFGDAWYSRDGLQWHELRTETIWSQRHEHSTYVHDDRIWVVGGNAWPLVDDVWQLSLPQDWSGAG